MSRPTNDDEDSVEIYGFRFTSRLLRDNLDKVERVFPLCCHLWYEGRQNTN